MQGMASGNKLLHWFLFQIAPAIGAHRVYGIAVLCLRTIVPVCELQSDRLQVEQLALCSYVKSGQLERHLRRLRKLYAAKSIELIRSVQKAFGPRCRLFLQTALRLTLFLPMKLP